MWCNIQKYFLKVQGVTFFAITRDVTVIAIPVNTDWDILCHLYHLLRWP